MKEYYVGMPSSSGEYAHRANSYGVSAKNPLVGIELECVVNMDKNVEDLIKEAFSFKSLDFIPDEDCTLPSHSVELISKPIEFRKVVASSSSWKKFLKRAEDFVADIDVAGMHINISESEKEMGIKACWLGNGMWNLGKQVAGIKRASWNRFSFSSRPSEISLAYVKGMACAWRDNRVEFRFNRTTSDWNKFKFQTLYSKSLLDAARAVGDEFFEDEMEMTNWYVGFLKKNKGKYRQLLAGIFPLLPDVESATYHLSPRYSDSSSFECYSEHPNFYDYDEGEEEDNYYEDDYYEEDYDDDDDY